MFRRRKYEGLIVSLYYLLPTPKTRHYFLVETSPKQYHTCALFGPSNMGNLNHPSSIEDILDLTMAKGIVIASKDLGRFQKECDTQIIQKKTCNWAAFFFEWPSSVSLEVCRDYDHSKWLVFRLESVFLDLLNGLTANHSIVRIMNSHLITLCCWCFRNPQANHRLDV